MHNQSANYNIEPSFAMAFLFLCGYELVHVQLDIEFIPIFQLQTNSLVHTDIYFDSELQNWKFIIYLT
jgi:hypothetical protein